MATSKPSLPKDMDEKLKGVLHELNTSSGEVRKKLKHVVPVVQTNMPKKLESALATSFAQFPVSYDYETPRFDVDDPEAYEHLEEHGFVVDAPFYVIHEMVLFSVH